MARKENHSDPQQPDDKETLFGGILEGEDGKASENQTQQFSEYVNSGEFERVMRTDYKKNADQTQIQQYKDEGRDPRFAPLINDVFAVVTESQQTGEIFHRGRIKISFIREPKRPFDKYTRRTLLLVAKKVNRDVRNGRYRFADYSSGEESASHWVPFTVAEYMKECRLSDPKSARKLLLETIDVLRSIEITVTDRHGNEITYYFAPRRYKDHDQDKYGLLIDGLAMEMFNPAGNTVIHLPPDLEGNDPDAALMAYELYSWSHQYEGNPNMCRRIRMRTFIKRLSFVMNPEAESYTGTKENSRLSRSVMGPIVRTADVLKNEAGYLKWWDIVPHGMDPINPDAHEYMRDHLITQKNRRRGQEFVNTYPSYRDLINCDFVYEFDPSQYDYEWAADWCNRHPQPEDTQAGEPEQQKLLPDPDDPQQ